MALNVDLTKTLSDAFAQVAGREVDPVLRPSTHAHFQANGALALAKELGKAPRDIAADVVAALAGDGLIASTQISGPGFINITVEPEALAASVTQMAKDSSLGHQQVGSPDVVVVDYSSPNVAKEMHVGHLRSNIIGDATVRTLEFAGHKVIKANHLGDWGTSFGMLIEHMVEEGLSAETASASVKDLTAFYQAARVKFDADEAFVERSRQRVVKLQGGDEETLGLWRTLVKVSQEYFEEVYDKLDMQLTRDDYVGESFYNPLLPPLVEELQANGMLQKSDGALVVFPDGFVGREGQPTPLIVQKSDGGFGYATTDLAAIRYRIKELGATRVLYVVGMPQRQHFAMIFESAKEAGWLTPEMSAEFVGFGHVMGKDGKTLKTRSGETIKLISLIDEAVERATELVAEKNPDLGAEKHAEVGRSVGIGAMKYADLSNDRIKDYTFDFDRMVSFEGNTAPYLQYAHARICSMLRKAEVLLAEAPTTCVVREPAEEKLALQLDAWGGVISEVESTLGFHTLCNYLYECATAFSAFYEQCPVLKSEGAERESRLALCALTARVLRQGLDLLGIDAPEAM